MIFKRITLFLVSPATWKVITRKSGGQLWRDNSRRVRNHEKNSGETVCRLVTVIQSIFCAQSGASIRLTVWKWSCESRYPWALPPVLENFRRAFSPGPTDCPWVSEDKLKQTPLEVSQSAVSLLENCPLNFQLLGRRNSLLTRTELLFLMICLLVLNIFPSQTPLVSTTTN